MGSLWPLARWFLGGKASWFQHLTNSECSKRFTIFPYLLLNMWRRAKVMQYRFNPLAEIYAMGLVCKERFGTLVDYGMSEHSVCLSVIWNPLQLYLPFINNSPIVILIRKHLGWQHGNCTVSDILLWHTSYIKGVSCPTVHSLL